MNFRENLKIIIQKILKDQRTKGLATGAVIGGAYKLGEEKGKGKK